MKIAFLGGGNMANALVGGLIGRGFAAGAISVIEVSPPARQRISRHGVRVSTAPDAATQDADVLVLAVKPQDLRAALSDIGIDLRHKLIVSIAAGIRLATLASWLGGHARLVRCMPNTPALLGAGITGLYAAAQVGADDRQNAEAILRAVGEVVWLRDERLLDPVTAVSASGPAYVFWFIEQLAAFAEQAGIPHDDALRLAKHCLFGSAKLALESDLPPSELRRAVTSKGGTTEAALNVFEREKLAERFARALEAAARRGAELGDLLERG